MRSPLEELLALLDLEQIGDDLYRGLSPPTAGRMVYGGQAVAQALVAAQRTVVADRPVHSLHAYFILPGDPRTPIDFMVERVRDGRSFTTRRCAATQRGRTIFSLEASFQIEETGLEHAFDMPKVPPPESLAPTNAVAERFKKFLPRAAAERLEQKSAVDIRVVDPGSLLFPGPPASVRQHIWFRVDGHLPDDQAIHRALLAYLSDMTLLNTALVAHGRVIYDPTLQVASLDHALWFHRPFRADEWLLYAQDSPAAAGARALTRGQLFSRDGALVASVAQEGLIRFRPDKK
jgi:acyl-CoA thioesterase-2